MGNFDLVRATDARFSCSEGHPPDDLFQTKDLGETRGLVEIVGDVLRFAPGAHLEPQDAGLLKTIERISIYSSCKSCPAFVAPGTWNTIDCWVEHEIELGVFIETAVNMRQIMSVRRTSPSTSEFVVATPLERPGCEGPMPWDEAVATMQRRRAAERR